MSDDLAARLEEAKSQYTQKRYEACAKVLSGLPQDDPKVTHNTAICDAVISLPNHRSVVAKLDLPPIQRVKNAKTGLFEPTVVLRYRGEEVALLNAAALYLHNGSLHEARNILFALAALSSQFTPAVRARIAVLLHVATRRTSIDASTTTAALLQDAVGHESDAASASMVSIAFSDVAGLHSWFNGSAKTPAERAVYLNNLAIEAFAEGKGAVAAIYLEQATTCIHPDETCKYVVDSIAYNSAVCALSRGSAEGAVGALLRARQSMSGSPLLWIRLAQALILQAQDAAKARKTQEYLKTIGEHIAEVQQGLPPRFPAIPPMNTGVAPEDAGALLVAAANALHNALSLLVERNEKLVEATRRLAAVPETALYMDTVLTNLAYVELARGNCGAVIAIVAEYNVIEREVKLATAPRSQAVMACYHIEALCLSNKSSQALRVLQSMNLGHYVGVKAPNATIEALMLNVCTAYIMNGQWAKASQLSQHLLSKLPSPVAQLLTAYLELAQGNRTVAAETIEGLPQTAIETR